MIVSNQSPAGRRIASAVLSFISRVYAPLPEAGQLERC
jgi:hypothetical protein